MDTTYNLQELLATDIRTVIPSDIVTSIISEAPFVTVSGVSNLRDLGGSSVRPGFAHRSGLLTGISDEGKAALVTRGITTIFDLRNPGERTKRPSPVIDSINTIWEPYTRDPVLNPRDFAEENGVVAAFVGMYTHILEISTPIFRKVFEHVKFRPQEPFLFHCNAGKDRTGVLAALILLLVESPHEAIIHDYLLTRVGVEPFRQAFMASGGMDLDNPAERNIGSVREGAMVAFIEAVEERFGGVTGYLTKNLDFSVEDVVIIRANLKSVS